MFLSLTKEQKLSFLDTCIEIYSNPHDPRFEGNVGMCRINYTTNFIGNKDQGVLYDHVKTFIVLIKPSDKGLLSDWYYHPNYRGRYSEFYFGLHSNHYPDRLKFVKDVRLLVQLNKL